MDRQTDRHHCPKSGNIPKMEGGQIDLNIVTVLRFKCSSTDTKKMLEERYFIESMPCLPREQFSIHM